MFWTRQPQSAATRSLRNSSFRHSASERTLVRHRNARRPQSFTAPSISPRTKARCPARNTSTAGTTEIVFPRGLAPLLARLLAGDYPQQPVELPW